MVRVDMTQPDRDMTPGVDLWEVKTGVSKTSTNNTPMLSLEFKRVVGQGLLYDNVMLGGGGWGIGKAKLTALGIPKTFSGDLNVTMLVGKRVYIATVVGEYTDKKGQQRSKLEVDINELEHAGYQSESKPPPGLGKTVAGAPPAATAGAGFTDAEVDDTPF